MSSCDPEDKLKVNVDRVICGSLMTSLEMAGVSLTLLKLDPGSDWDQYIGMVWYAFYYIKCEYAPPPHL